MPTAEGGTCSVISRSAPSRFEPLCQWSDGSVRREDRRRHPRASVEHRSGRLPNALPLSAEMGRVVAGVPRWSDGGFSESIERLQHGWYDARGALDVVRATPAHDRWRCGMAGRMKLCCETWRGLPAAVTSGYARGVPAWVAGHPQMHHRPGRTSLTDVFRSLRDGRRRLPYRTTLSSWDMRWRGGWAAARGGAQHGTVRAKAERGRHLLRWEAQRGTRGHSCSCCSRGVVRPISDHI